MRAKLQAVSGWGLEPGATARRSHVEILIDLIRAVEGVVGVKPAVGYRFDDRTIGANDAGGRHARTDALAWILQSAGRRCSSADWL